MREIKFRIWHKKHLKMFQLTAIDFATGFAGCRTEKATINLCIRCKDIKPCFAPYFHLADLEVLQYTGLKDKNGKEIYEGDMVALKYLGDFDDKGKVVWTDNGSRFYIEPKGYPDIHGYSLGDPLVMDLCVIGNIYENKNLLEQE